MVLLLSTFAYASRQSQLAGAELLLCIDMQQGY